MNIIVSNNHCDLAIKQIIPRFRNEQGSMIILGLFGTLALLFVSALVIDIGRLEYATRSIQTAADAIALASTFELNGTNSGWMAGKRAAVMLLRENTIHGAENSDIDVLGPRTINFHRNVDPREASSGYESTEYTFDNIHAVIERGYYYSPNNDGIFRFQSLEGLGGVTTIIPEAKARNCQIRPYCNVSWVANATRVQLELKQFNLFFAGIINFEGGLLRNITREAISAKSNFA